MRFNIPGLGWDCRFKYQVSDYGFLYNSYTAAFYACEYGSMRLGL